MIDWYDNLGVVPLPVGPLEVNCYLVLEKKSQLAIVVDPGAEGYAIQQRIEDLGVTIQMVVLTHGHADHLGAVDYLRRKFRVPVAVGQADAEMLVKAELNLSDALGEPLSLLPADALLSENDTVAVGEATLQVLHTPGHTPGSITLLSPRFVLSGDLVFAGSIGRTDLPGGDYRVLLDSVKCKLFSLDDNLVIYPGHGPTTTVGREKLYNPFLAGA